MIDLEHTWAADLGAGTKNEDGRLTIKRLRIQELEEENERLHLRIATLEADLREERAKLK